MKLHHSSLPDQVDAFGKRVGQESLQIPIDGRPGNDSGNAGHHHGRDGRSIVEADQFPRQIPGRQPLGTGRIPESGNRPAGHRRARLPCHRDQRHLLRRPWPRSAIGGHRPSRSRRAARRRRCAGSLQRRRAAGRRRCGCCPFRFRIGFPARETRVPVQPRCPSTGSRPGCNSRPCRCRAGAAPRQALPAWCAPAKSSDPAHPVHPSIGSDAGHGAPPSGEPPPCARWHGSGTARRVRGTTVPGQ